MLRGVEDEGLNRAVRGLHGAHRHCAGGNRYLEYDQSTSFGRVKTTYGNAILWNRTQHDEVGN